MLQNQDIQGFWEVVQAPAATNIRFEVIFDTGSFFPPHWHHAIEIILILEGDFEVNIQQQKYLLTKNDCIVINTDLVHSTKCLQQTRYLLVQVPIAFLETFLPAAGKIAFTWDIQPADPMLRKKANGVKQLLQQMLFLEREKPDGYLLSFNSLLFRLLSRLYHDFGIRLSTDEVHSPAQNIDRLSPVIEYTAAHYSRPVSIDEIARVAAFKPEYFCRFFKKHMGITYLEYLNRIRMSHIYRDLLDTKEPVYKLLEKHGFTNYKLFRRMFREQFHATPSQVRKLNSSKMPV